MPGDIKAVHLFKSVEGRVGRGFPVRFECRVRGNRLIHTPEHALLLRGPPIGGVTFRQDTGSVLCDYLQAYNCSADSVSSEFEYCLRRHQLKGWRTYEAEVLTKKGAKIPGYRGLVVTGRAKKWDIRRIREVEYPARRGGGTFTLTHGYDVYRDGWDGSDFFTVGRQALVLVSARAAKVLRDSGLRGFDIPRLDEYGFRGEIH